MNGIDRAILSNERYVAAIDRLMQRAAGRQDTSQVLFLSQLRENARYLLTSLRQIRHRPEITGQSPSRMVKMPGRPQERKKTA